ncbi:nicotinate-nucleotide adenylyltransferase [Peptostreptococcus equinus]|uniref:Probable nicotinate-nucleotide adenylyltransferase n=1 Tax=Peptostreptococcus equinus TaxID=3003601 RepID=A0ABY7JLT3_9FIRM|nr:nicotinate-nucleotide adenylyltransferase [Peptostreptococcus sp. CBA3647]WAW14277.1 nicotinate-nucleotide adenylyltransferase [Peptostreptococcus sp. CBA3647]
MISLNDRLLLSHKVNAEKIQAFKANKKKSKIGIMGGSFNPIHNAHLATAEFIRDKYDLDKVMFVPTGDPPHKKQILDKKHRYNMVILATLKNEDFFVSNYEVKLDGEKSYTVDTLRHIKDTYPNEELYYITGSDSLNTIETWKEFEKIFENTKFIAAMRPGINLLETQENIERFRKEYNADIEMLYVPSLEISSTYIRSRLKSSNSIKYLVPSRVEEYIYTNKLYGGVKK